MSLFVDLKRVFYGKDEIDSALSDKETVSNKVTSISSSSTNTQYPSAKCVYDTIETKIDKLQRTVTTFNPIDYVVGEDGAVWDNDNDNTVTLPNNGSNITFNFTDMLNDTGDYFEWEFGVSHGTIYMVDDEHSDEIWNSSVNSMIRIKITKNEYSDSYHITTTDLSNNTIIKDYDKDYHFNLTFITLNGVTVSFSSKKWYHTVSFIDMVYPIGSIYMSVNSINPSLFIGGFWEQIQDCFLLASGRTYQSGTTGGSATVTLTANQSGVKSHAHTISHTHGVGNGRQFATRSDHSDGVGEKGAASGTAFYVPTINKSDNWYGTAATSTQSTTNSGNATAANASEAHENMPPYLSVYMWKRTA